MNRAIGLIETNGIAKGIQAWDEMMKVAGVELITATTTCPGKYIVVVGGEVGAVITSVEKGKEVAGRYLINYLVIPNVHPQVFPALTASVEIEEIEALGIIECFSIASSIIMADAAVKSASVNLLEVRLAMGLGGKSLVIFTGEVGAVESAVKAALSAEKDRAMITEVVIIPRPHKSLIEKF